MDPLSWSLLTVSQTNASLPEKGVFGYIVLLLLLILVNAYFAASELAIVSLNDAKLEKMAQEGNRKARSLFEMTSKPTTFLSTIQIGVTLSGFLSSAVAADTFADYIVYLFRNLSIDLSVVRIISIFVCNITQFF